MVKNKYIILSFLFIAWAIIFAHSIIPHHHHSENFHSECNHHSHETHFSEILEINSCDNDCNDHACHFHVEVFTKITIDNIFIVNIENSLFNSNICIETSNPNYCNEFISDQIPQANYLRGPPVIS